MLSVQGKRLRQSAQKPGAFFGQFPVVMESAFK